MLYTHGIKIVGDDMWDPNNWAPDDHEHRVYSDESLYHYCVVDAWVYPLLMRWKWSNFSKKHSDRGFLYLRRSTAEFHGPDGEKYINPETGYLVRHRNRTVRTRFLHVEILLLSGQPQPTPKHEGDHINRKTWDCRLVNLKWATRQEQVLNSSYVENMAKAREARWR